MKLTTYVQFILSDISVILNWLSYYIQILVFIFIIFPFTDFL